MVEREEAYRIGAGRVIDHAILGPLPLAEAVRFTFDDVSYEGRAGEPIVAALLASGARVLRTMPELGDARGGYCMIGRCTDCQVVVNGVPGVRACLAPVADGLEVRTQRGLGDESAMEPAN